MTNTNNRREELLNDIAYAQDLIDWYTADIKNLKAEKTQIGNERYEINRVRYSQFRVTTTGVVCFVRNGEEYRAFEEDDTVLVYAYDSDRELAWRALPRAVKNLVERAFHLAKSLASCEKSLSNWVAEQAEAKAELESIDAEKTTENKMKITVKEMEQKVYGEYGRVIGKKEGRVLEANVKSLQGLRVWCRHHNVEDADFFQDDKQIGYARLGCDRRGYPATVFFFN